MSRKSLVLVFFLVFSVSSLLPLFLPSYAAADTMGWYLQDTGTEGVYFAVSAVDSDTVWAGGGAVRSKAAIARSTDGGNTWKQAVLESSADATWLTGISGADADTAWGVGLLGDGFGLGGIIAGTLDEGATLNLQASDPRGKFNGVSAVDSQTAYVVGSVYPDYPAIMKTTDGVTWSIVGGEAISGSPLYGISAVDANIVWAVGTNGMILKTIDGTNWVHQDFSTTAELNGVSALDVNTAWAVGDDGLIIHTTDGSTWVQQDSGVTVPLTSVSAVNANTVWAVGTSGTILKSVDGGETWVQQDSGVTVNLTSVSAVDANIAWAAGQMDSVLLHTTTGGVIPSPTITSVTPASGVENAIVDVTNLAGADFQDGATVRIVGASKTIDATEVNVVSSTRITCKLNLTGAPLGKYDMVVKNPDDQEATLTRGFSVTNVCGGGAAVSLSLFGVMMGLMSLAGSAGLRRRFWKKKR